MTTVEIDFAYDQSAPLSEVLDAFVGEDDVDWDVVEHSGPAGGWPVVALYGTVDALRRVLERGGYDADLYFP